MAYAMLERIQNLEVRMGDYEKADQRNNEDVGSLANDVIDIKAIVEAHTKDLTEIRGALSEHGETLAEHGKRFDQIDVQLVDVKTQLKEIRDILVSGK